MEHSLWILGGLALVDSINPSALLVTLYLLWDERPARSVAAYMAGVFATYFSFGVLLVVGLDALLTKFHDALWSPGAYAVQGVVGLAMFIYSFRPVRDDPGGTELRVRRASGLLGLFGLGAAITVVELTTAMPYVGATGLLTYWQWPTHQWVAALLAYNVIFVLPPFALLGLHALFGSRFAERTGRLQGKLARASREAVLWIVGIVGFGLAADAALYFEFFGLFELPAWLDGAGSLRWRQLNLPGAGGLLPR